MAVVEALVRNSDGRAELRGTCCRDCERYAFPPREVCGFCGSRRSDEAWLSGRGTVHAFTEVGIPPAGFDAPYLFAVVDLEEGPRTVGILREAPPRSARVQAVPGPVRDGVGGFVFAAIE